MGHSDILSIILSDTLSIILSDILSIILSDILSIILYDILSIILSAILSTLFSEFSLSFFLTASLVLLSMIFRVYGKAKTDASWSPKYFHVGVYITPTCLPDSLPICLLQTFPCGKNTFAANLRSS